MIVSVLVVALAVTVFPFTRAEAQDNRRIIPAPREIQIESVDPVTKAPRSSFCIGFNTIDLRVTNNSEYRRSIYVINRDTRGRERTLYAGWLDPGSYYLSTLMRTQFELVGPAGTEAVRVSSNEYGQQMQGRWVTYYVQDCGGYPPDGGGAGMLWAQIYPNVIAQGSRATITLQTNVESRPNQIYYFEILNSWGQLWKRLPVSRRPYDQYQVLLPVGTRTRPGYLTYTVNLWQESNYAGGRRKIATTQFSFQVVTPGSAVTPYQPDYQGYWGTPYGSGYPESQGWNPYGGNAYSGSSYYSPLGSYMLPSLGGYSSGSGYQMQGQGERAIE